SILALRLVDQHRNPCVDLRCQLRVSTRAENGGCSGIRIDASDVSWRQREATLWIDKLSRIGKEKRKACRTDVSSQSEQAELDSAVDRRKDPFSVFKIDQRD